MKKLLCAVALVALNSACRAAAIDFNDGADGSAIGAFYSGLGVTFSNAEWDGFVSVDEGLVGAGGLKLVGIGPDFGPKVGTPIVAVFSSAQSAVSIRGLNVGDNGARIDAYDATVGGSVIDFDEDFGLGAGISNHPLLAVAGASIWRVELYQPLSTSFEGLLFDNLTFTAGRAPAVPEPGSLALLAGGLVALRRRRRR